MDTLWPEQQKALNRIKYNWENGKHTIIITGQRSGKSYLLRYLLDDLRGSGVDEDDVYVVGATRRQAEDNTRGTVYSATVLAFKTLQDDISRVTQDPEIDEFLLNKYKNKYVLIDEVLFLTDNITTILIKLHNLEAKIFAIGSRSNALKLNISPVFDVQYYATWDWNPVTPITEYIEQWKKNNYEAERDFGFKDSRSISVETIMAACKGETNVFKF